MIKMWILHKITLLLLWMMVKHTEEIAMAIEESQDHEIEQFFYRYVDEVTRTLRLGSEEHLIVKRSHPDVDLNKLTGVELLVGFQKMYTLPAKFPIDIVLFSLCSDKKPLYSVALETKLEKSMNVIDLVLYKFQGYTWMETHRVNAAGGVSLAVEQIHDAVYVIVAQQQIDEDQGSMVFQLDSDSETLQFVHSLKTHIASHAIMWTEIFTYAAIAIAENPPASRTKFSTQSPVYQWLGNSFDMIDVLPTYNPRALTHFNLHSSMFIAVANFQNDLGETAIDSEIFRYNLASGKFNVYQKLPTEAAVDVKYFCFESNPVTESFLIFASAFHQDNEGYKNYNTVSLVYKLSDEEYFVPFQALQASKVTSWLPVRHGRGGMESLTLVGASDEGIISFQYDGWRFVPTGLLYDRSTFGPGPKSLNVFYFKDQTFISCANKDSYGDDANVFKPVFKRHGGIENIQKTIARWVEQMTQEITEGKRKMAELIRTASEAPSIKDPVIELGSHVVFKNANIDRLETFVTTERDHNTDAKVFSQLYGMKNQLEGLQKMLNELPNRINQLSIHTNTIYEDQMELTADIKCTHSCHVQDLKVININGENLSEFLNNTVNIEEPVEFTGEITFNELALIDPLETKTINGHLKETMIDWSKEVIINQKFQVAGDVEVEDSLSVTGAIDGVFVNIIKDEESTEPTVVVAPSSILESLNTNQLVLSDNKLSQVDFNRFNSSTLKTHGNQVFTEFQDIENLEAEEVIGDLFTSGPDFPILKQVWCKDATCSELWDMTQEIKSRAKASGSNKNIESINLLDDEIIIPRNMTIYGTLIVENGSLSAEDLIDLKHNISAKKLREFGIPLNQTVISNHFKFNGIFETPVLNVDTINSLDLNNLVDPEELKPVRVTGKKEFKGLLTAGGPVVVTGTVNGVDLTQLEESLQYCTLHNLTVKSIISPTVKLGENGLNQLVKMREEETVYLNSLNVKEDMSVNSVAVWGQINNYHLEKLLNDTVFKHDDYVFITGAKHFLRGVKIHSFSLNNASNNNLNIVTPENLWRRRLSKAKRIEVDRLFYTGKLDGVDARDFGKWMLTEGDQTVTASQTMTSLQAENLRISAGGIFNSININQLFTEAVFLSDNATFDHVVFQMPVVANKVEVGGRIGELQIPADLFLTDSTTDQQITGRKRVLGSVVIGGNLHTSSHLSTVNLTSYCYTLGSTNSSLAISANVKFKEEPTVSTSINGIQWSDITRDIWFREDNVTILDKVIIEEAEFKNLVVKNINNNNIEEKLSKLFRLSQDQIINGTFYFSNVTVKKGLEAGETSVGGDVQGIRLPEFVKHVLLDGLEQEIEAYLDLSSLTIDNELVSTGLVNGLNFSTDVMLANVTSNTITSSLMLNKLSTGSLSLPRGASVAGVNLGLWNRTVVKKSDDNFITGNIVFMGQFDSARGIRVEHLVNGVHFDENQLMLSDVPQEISGTKIFASDSDVDIHQLQVKGFLNDWNITDFYDQQVTAKYDMRISGRKKFLSPLWSEKVFLPEIYQDHNLTWLETQLAAPLPWARYRSQLAMMDHLNQLANLSLQGHVYYLKNITRVRDVEGNVRLTFPLKNNNMSLVAAVRKDSNKITLSLLTWSDKHNMFLDTPGSVRYFPKVVPSGVQSITLPGGELAAYITTYLPYNSSTSGHGDLFRLKDGLITKTTIYGGKPGSILLSFLDYKARTCFVLMADRCRVFCHEEGGHRVRHSSFSCQNITKATMFTTERGPYMIGIQTGLQDFLVLWRLSGKKFTQVLQLPVFNPVSIATTTGTGPHMAVAHRHRLGHSRPETVDIYRFNENTSELLLEQSLACVSPAVVEFSSLPSSESLLYVASDNRASPLHVYIYRGILGYIHFTAVPTLPLPTHVQAFTDHHRRHFIVVPSNHSCSVLKAQFEGEY